MTTNTLLTAQQITRKALALFLNSNTFLKNIDRQYDSSFAQDGAKIGANLKIRLPNDYIVRNGATFAPQGTAEQNTTLSVSTQKGVDLAFSSVDRALSLDDYADRILAPAMNNLSAAVALDVMSTAESIPNFISNVDGSANIISPVADTWLGAGALLDQYGVPRGLKNRMVVMDPQTQRRTVSSFTGFFNNQSSLGKQYDSGEMDTALGFRYNMDQTVLLHTTGAYSTLGTVSGASQTGTAITTSALAGPLVAGDVITFAGVYAVNRATKQTTGALAQFVVTANVATSATSIPIYPALTPGSVSFQTVTASPANSAVITVASKASEAYRKNIAFDPRAFTFASADLVLPKGVHEAYRASFGGVSMRLITDYIMGSDELGTRLDIVYGYKCVRPEWAVVVADKL